jgi:hypothetical protein
VKRVLQDTEALDTFLGRDAVRAESYYLQLASFSDLSCERGILRPKLLIRGIRGSRIRESSKWCTL